MKALNRSVILIICNSAIIFIISLFNFFEGWREVAREEKNQCESSVIGADTQTINKQTHKMFKKIPNYSHTHTHTNILNLT